MIPYNKPYLTGKEMERIQEAAQLGKLSGGGYFTRKDQDLLEALLGTRKCLLTSSCTDALEMAAILLDIRPGDEVIMPSYTFVSTANAFVLRGAKVVFADSSTDDPNIAPEGLTALITGRTKAIVVVHYAGIACDMDPIMAIAKKHGLWVVEDAAHALGATYKGRQLGTIGHLGALSFHETKNIHCGEGGCLLVNDERFSERAEVIWNKGTNRSAFERGEVNKYTWMDVGSSFQMSEMSAAFLFAQLENYRDIQSRRVGIWKYYLENLTPLQRKGALQVTSTPAYAIGNGHIFYLSTKTGEERERLLEYLQRMGIMAIFHYVPLHLAPFYHNNGNYCDLPNAQRFGENLVRLPLYVELSLREQEYIVDAVVRFYGS